jgi:hypothetical protein
MPLLPSKAKEEERKKAELDRAMWKKTDPIYALRQCLGNSMRSKHWRVAHKNKKHFLDVAKNCAQILGAACEPPVLVVMKMAISSRMDTDAPVKALLDAFQDVLFTTGDDSAAGPLVLIPYHPARGGKNQEEMIPHVTISAASMSKDPATASRMLSEAMREYDEYQTSLDKSKGPQGGDA